jgi:hypothetical protein
MVTPNGNQGGNQKVTLQSSSSSSISIYNIYKTKPQKRAPSDFVVSKEMREWAANEVPSVDIDFSTKTFMDHEFKTAHTDWKAVWRNWMRNPLNSRDNGNKKIGSNLLTDEEKEIYREKGDIWNPK